LSAGARWATVGEDVTSGRNEADVHAVSECPPGRGDSVSVVTVDDQPFFRDAARDVIEATPGFEAVGEASSGEEALGIVEELAPRLVLVDVRMPEMDGIETTRRIKAAHPEVVVVLISIEDATNIPAAARTSGAAGHMQKQDFGPVALKRLWSAHGTEARSR
jgi:two-component system, NarL family, invasion response regulator UvrY